MIRIKYTIKDLLQENLYLPYLIISIATIVLYVQTVSFEFTNLDDKAIILNNFDIIGNISNITKAFTSDAFCRTPGYVLYRPMQTVTFMMDAYVGGKNPWIYHTTNVILHLITCCLLYRLLIVLIPSSPLNFLLALLYCVHPLFTHAVAWVPSRGDLLICCFGIASFLTFRNSIEGNRWYMVIAHSLLFSLTLFSKESAIVFPIMYGYYYFFIYHKRKLNNRLIVLVSIWAIVIGLYLFLRSQVVMTAASDQLFGITPLGKNYPILLIIIGKFFLPFHLTTMPVINTLSVVMGIIVFIVLGLLIYSVQRKQVSIIFLGILWYLLFLLPSLFYRHPEADITFDFFDHRMYLPCVGIVILIADLLAKKLELNQKKWVAYAMGIIIILFSLLTIHHSQDYKDAITFCSSAIAENPRNVVAYHDRGYAKLLQNDISGALDDYSKKIEIRRDDALAYYDRGNVYYISQNYDSALNDYDRAIQLDSSCQEFYYNRALTQWHLHNYTGCIFDCDKALELSPTDINTYLQRGQANDALGQVQKALRDYDLAIYYSPHNVECFKNRASARCRAGDFKGAIDDCSKALTIDPSNAEVYYYRSFAYNEMKNFRGSLSDLDSAISFNQNYDLAYYQRGWLRLQLNDRVGACEDFRKLDLLGFPNAKQLLNTHCKN